ncbi:uncharacterized protein C8Q71DRAFT_771993 [Rhodofomes roseus]|uniref:Uncharacterized protein n=1 Tax=Rhodofomes roseus TaxID=34475 RepID=A0ABQ8KA13_9APHY|nr:uncharacterized protein C8Q71DRAFT_771993 [Rhodofomes roseus]KAH9833661.1 hypothetical protein C8Q71DRAFT_771993 [Rhodofomes roseus]
MFKPYFVVVFVATLLLPIATAVPSPAAGAEDSAPSAPDWRRTDESLVRKSPVAGAEYATPSAPDWRRTDGSLVHRSPAAGAEDVAL